MADEESTNKPLPARGAYLLPNALTTAALLAGFYAIIAAVQGEHVAACIAVVVAGLLDGIDGRVARMTGTQSEFGTQYDSLSDMVSFGIAPAILVWSWSLSSVELAGPIGEKIGWLSAFFYSACGALRLARFNTQAGVADKRYFQGLASPAAAGTLVSTIWFCESRGIGPEAVAWPMLVLTVMLGALMVSRLRYSSFKGGASRERERVPIAWIFVLLVVIVLLAIDLPAVLFTIGVLYVSSGLIVTLRGRYQRRRKRRPDDERKPNAGREFDDGD
ncbi:MAG TPA: CDP-diacylglycerol--serine O-phosphatidyltransferase [Wenzhouxiangellaceae bacterium]|nr:CDP-diacylglycerol--serine O-phosphatidyltransferase [Wenzhouxiangellaceae bacterium]